MASFSANFLLIFPIQMLFAMYFYFCIATTKCYINRKYSVKIKIFNRYLTETSCFNSIQLVILTIVKNRMKNNCELD